MKKIQDYVFKGKNTQERVDDDLARVDLEFCPGSVSTIRPTISEDTRRISRVVERDVIFIRIDQVRELLGGLSKPAIYNRLDPKSRYYDPSFPRQYKLGSNPNCRAVGWRLDQILNYIKKISVNQVQEAA